MHAIVLFAVTFQRNELNIKPVQNVTWLHFTLVMLDSSAFIRRCNTYAITTKSLYASLHNGIAAKCRIVDKHTE